MCGISCIWFKEGVDYKITDTIMRSIEKRGKDAFGYVIIRDKKIYKVEKFDKSYSDSNVVWDDLKVNDILLANCRARPMTELPSTDESTIQPIIYEDEGIVLVHNGVVANEQEVFERKTKIDSEVFLYRYLKHGRQAIPAVEETVGGSAYIMVDLKREMLIAIRDFKPLGKAYIRGIGYFIQSDREEFYNICGNMDVAVWEWFYYSDLTPFCVQEIDINSGLINGRPFEPLYRSSLLKKNDNKVLVIASGGVDSSVAACVAKYHLNKEVELVHFNFGQKSQKGELKSVQYLSELLKCKLHIINLPWLGTLGASPLTSPSIEVPKGEVKENLKSTICWTPARNLVFLSVAASIAEATGASEVYNGFSLEEEGAYPDNSLDFFRSMNSVLDFGTLTRPRVKMIEANLMKPELITLALFYGLDFNKLWSCDTYNETEKECKVCGACTLKQLAINQSLTLDRTVDEILARVRK